MASPVGLAGGSLALSVANRRCVGPLLVAIALSSPGAAHAELGGPLSSVRADQARMGAQMSSAPMGAYTRHGLTRRNGGEVRELTNGDGQVFAVTWSGPGKPDLRALLGQHFEAFQAANARAGRFARALRRPQQVSGPDLQIQAGGHMGWFHGAALVPSLAPPGFSAGELAQEP